MTPAHAIPVLVLSLLGANGLGLTRELPQASSSDRAADDLARKLEESARKGNVQDVQALLAQGANPNLRHSLLQAARNGHAAVVRHLIDAKADPNRDDGGKTPLAEAAAAKHWATVRVLVDAGASVLKADGRRELNPADDETRALISQRRKTERAANLQLLVASRGDQGPAPHGALRRGMTLQDLSEAKILTMLHWKSWESMLRGRPPNSNDGAYHLVTKHDGREVELILDAEQLRLVFWLVR